MVNKPPDRYDKPMNDEQKAHLMGFIEDVRAHLEAGAPTVHDAVESLTAIAFNAIVAIEKIKRS